MNFVRQQIIIVLPSYVHFLFQIGNITLWISGVSFEDNIKNDFKKQDELFWLRMKTNDELLWKTVITNHRAAENAASSWLSEEQLHFCLTNYLSWRLLLKDVRVKGKVFPIHAMKAYGGSRCIAPLILTFSATQRWVVNFMPGGFTLRKEPQYRLNTRMCGSHNQSRRILQAAASHCTELLCQHLLKT
jgi:hypothetical protein